MTAHMTCVYVRRCPTQCSHLSGLLDMFREHVDAQSPPSTLPPIRVTVRLSYQVDVGKGTPTTVVRPPPPTVRLPARRGRRRLAVGDDDDDDEEVCRQSIQHVD